jgi:hypothetical protein
MASARLSQKETSQAPARVGSPSSSGAMRPDEILEAPSDRQPHTRDASVRTRPKGLLDHEQTPRNVDPNHSSGRTYVLRGTQNLAKRGTCDAALLPGFTKQAQDLSSPKWHLLAQQPEAKLRGKRFTTSCTTLHYACYAN